MIGFVRTLYFRIQWLDEHHSGGHCALIVVGLAVLFAAAPSEAQLTPERTYYGVNRSIPMQVGAREAGAPTPQITLYDPGSNEPLRRATVAEGRVDLAALFPIIWTRAQPDLLYAQLRAGGVPIGSPVVLQPLLSPPEASDQFTAAIAQAIAQGDSEELASLMSIPASQKARLQQAVRTPPVEEQSFSGLRVWVDRHVVLETSAGAIELRLRPDHAPNTCFHFLSLVEGGFYDDTIVHRIIATDARGRPFLIQAGDPTGLGFGGPGVRIDFEPSDLAHDFGVVSLARRPFEPNSGGSQFFICLGREACASLDGLYTSFAEVIDGADAVETIAHVDVGPVDPENPASPHERPLDPPVIHTARSIPAAPFPLAPPRVTSPAPSIPR